MPRARSFFVDGAVGVRDGVVSLGANRMNIAVLWHPKCSGCGGRRDELGGKSLVYNAFWHPDNCGGLLR